ncbi:MAG: hypothetical protein ACTHK7_14960 [Aureliella sp.]
MANAPPRPEDALPEIRANPAAPLLGFVGLLYLFLSPAALLFGAPHAGILSSSMFAFGAWTVYLAFQPYTSARRIATMAWGGVTTTVAFCALLATCLKGDMDGMIFSLVALLVTSPVLLLAVRERAAR